MRDGKWKLVALQGGPWELYDLETDRTELHDLASQHPDIVNHLAEAWKKWARRCWVERAGNKPAVPSHVD